MAIDNTPPRLKLIVTIAAITVITLIGISFATQSYYAYMSDEAKHEKIAPTRDKEDQHKAEATAFGQAGIPIDQAMAQIAKGTRPDAITPNASDDVGPVTGWSKLPHPAPTTLQRTPAGAPEQPIVGDGGVMLYSDGGIMLGPDGGPLMAPPGAALTDGGVTDAGADGGHHRGGRRGGGGGNDTGGGGGTGTGGGTGGGGGTGTGGGNH